MLTPSEIESLRQDSREAGAYLKDRRARKQAQTGKDPLVSIRTKSGMRFYIRGEAEAKKLSELLGKD